VAAWVVEMSAEHPASKTDNCRRWRLDHNCPDCGATVNEQRCREITAASPASKRDSEQTALQATHAAEATFGVISRANGLIEIACKHGVGHPSNLLTNLLTASRFYYGTHGCDGCCGSTEFREFERATHEARMRASVATKSTVAEVTTEDAAHMEQK
jgi:hypothetical protein